jgi:hypothetical protein
LQVYGAELTVLFSRLGMIKSGIIPLLFGGGSEGWSSPVDGFHPSFKADSTEFVNVLSEI